MPLPKINRQPEEPASLFQRACSRLRPLIRPTLGLVPEPEFTTRQFIIYLRATDPGEEAYTGAVSLWKDNLSLGRQTIHGQIIPQLLRDEGQASFAGFVYHNPEEEDGLSVPTRWLKAGYNYPED